MNPGLLVKLRPAGPWRIGPDSGARNRVDSIYHSDSLYSAVSSAMARLGSLDGWLTGTARAAAPAVCFSSCFPFLDEIDFVVPPRTIWPPVAPALLAARVRWKSARFVPLAIVQTILAGRKLDEQHWGVDGPSQCLVPAGRPGPFRIDIRWSAAVDRLTGVSERHATACLEFRPGAGLWTVVSFLDEAARQRWLDPVKAAFRLLADTGFGGARSRGWGRAETPEFIEGQLPDMILPPPPRVEPMRAVEPETAPAPVEASPAAGEAATAPLAVEPEAEPAPVEAPPAAAEAATAPPAMEPEVTPPPVEQPPAAGEAAAAPLAVEPETAPAPVEEPPAAEAAVVAPSGIAPLAVEPETAPAPGEEPPAAAAPPEESRAEEPAAAVTPAPAAVQLHWLLSLFSPAPADAVDWTCGDYSVVTRGGRVESPAGSGELKKLVQMVAEGSVLCGGAPTGAAPDVAPDGFAHPVFRAGFAVAIPLPGARS
jgi:CRISPR type III-A-associated RAMP protein Csm4